MCEIMERLANEAAEEARWDMQRDNVLRMLNNGFDKSAIRLALGLTDEEFAELLVPRAG